MTDTKQKVEALLFSSGRKMGVEAIAKLVRSDSAEVLSALSSLKEDYDSKGSSIMMVDEGDGWKLTVREQYSNVVRKIVAETELSKTVMETLAVIAWKAPVLQSDIINIRTNKAYDHLAELENTGFITRSKHGRTKLIKLSERFFNYFDVKSSDDIKAKFRVESPQKTLVSESEAEKVADEFSEVSDSTEPKPLN